MGAVSVRGGQPFPAWEGAAAILGSSSRDCIHEAIITEHEREHGQTVSDTSGAEVLYNLGVLVNRDGTICISKH